MRKIIWNVNKYCIFRHNIKKYKKEYINENTNRRSVDFKKNKVELWADLKLTLGRRI